jgi:hypothetical protein
MLLMLLLGLPAGAIAATPPGGACATAVTMTQSTLESRGALVEVVRGTSDNPNNPHKGHGSLVFRLRHGGGSGQKNPGPAGILMDPPLQSGLARDLFAACGDVVEVTFNLAETDEATTLFRGRGGEVLLGVCLEIEDTQAWPAWGELYCP